MHLVLKTHVNQPIATVWNGFDRSLFNRLSPPFPPVEVVRFDGCLQGDVVHLRLNFLLVKQDWVSLIVDQQSTDQEIYFVDQGTRLPFFLTSWHHRHRLLRDSGNGTVIVDDIRFKTPFLVADILLYPVMWLLFTYRKPIYKRTFR
ncbi:hypothetical protein M0L20_20795 [Spirosoma sp. RP8]|uniref:Ligand-binding SRPBCC domain-containing protein n=1 Tax=Spirosoma liriopis TaxID=2937440 RepID=A0ABT0HRR9_9BACT|nr:hypothetical protein [Spirosoma liriopis]MCK8494318.1 hypothetical protein [Spirosoma liriopis]